MDRRNRQHAKETAGRCSNGAVCSGSTSNTWRLWLAAGCGIESTPRHTWWKSPAHLCRHCFCAFTSCSLIANEKSTTAKYRTNVCTRALNRYCPVARAQLLGQKIVSSNSRRGAGCAQRNTRCWARNIFRRRRNFLWRHYFLDVRFSPQAFCYLRSFIRHRSFFCRGSFFFFKSSYCIFYFRSTFCPVGRS